MVLTYEDFYKVANVTQHAEFERHLKDILFKPKERKDFYDQLLEVNPVLGVDTFKPYFELYAAERKTNQQDYTPDSVAKLLAILTRSDAAAHETAKYAGYDATAGTGSLLIQKWQDDRIQESPWSYVPHRYTYRADELADNVIPYLIHNLTIRGMNAIIVHGDVLTGKAKQIYFIQNSKDDFLAYSDVNVMPHSEDCMREFGITEWLEKPINHVESREVIWQYALPMKRKALSVNNCPKELPRPERKGLLTLSDVATIERAKKGEIYPRGTIVIQVSASSGQTGWLKSPGELDTKYAVVRVNPILDSYFMFQQIKGKMPKHLARVKEGLNVPVESLGELPVSITLATRPEMHKQLSLELE